ncbi:MAG: hypothetical protein JW838_05145 [Spirochaetes bacterium]|nr:hypothetical protein [Spirochaetota bacterium]
MKKIIAGIVVIGCVGVVFASMGISQLSPGAIDRVRPMAGDIPEGYIYGKIPEPYKKTLKDNPWMMDRAAIKRLADKVYPGGDHNRIAAMHVSIIANRLKPFNDDIVCYVILYQNEKAAREEMKKFSEYAGYNRDRALLLGRDNLAVFIFVDDIANYHYIQEMARTIDERLKGL